ncbi:MAG: response regulator, partial [Acidobacteria bacterium]|nr:response regulator [Acidobacteriota bacterium]
MRLLLLEGNPDDAILAREALQEIQESRRWRRWIRYLDVVHLECLDEALAVLAAERFDAALVAALLPDATGLDSLLALRLQAPDLPVVLMVADGDEPLALSAVREGAEDCVAKSELDCALLARALRNAVDRRRRVAALGSLTLLDAETGILNRAGFLLAAERERALARKLKRPVWVAVATLEGETGGFGGASPALSETAVLLRHSFSEADIIARIEPHRFAVLSICQQGDEAALALTELHRRSAVRLKVGIVSFGPDADWSVEELLGLAHGSVCENGP